jgi:hypothetical protein
MAQTALQKAVQQLSEYRDTYNPMCDEFTIIDKCIDELTDLLPYERVSVEAAYNIGAINGKLQSFNGISEFRNAKDYFTKTYNQ